MQIGNKLECRCPNAEEEFSNHDCSECSENILIGEEYIVNDNGDYAHWECVNDARDLAKFLGYSIKVMNYEDEYF